MQVLIEVGAAGETAEESNRGFDFGHARDGLRIGVVGVHGVAAFEAPKGVRKLLAAHDDLIPKKLHFVAILLRTKNPVPGTRLHHPIPYARTVARNAMWRHEFHKRLEGSPQSEVGLVGNSVAGDRELRGNTTV